MLEAIYVPSIESIWAIILSTLVMYAVILLMARTSGVRSFAEMSPFDVVVTIAIGSLMAGVLAARNPPLVEGATAVGTLYAVQLFVSELRARFQRVEQTTDTRPILLMGSGGRMLHANLQVARVTENDVRTHLRAANVADPGRVQAVVMEGTGSISVLHGDDPTLASHAWILQGVRDYSHPDGDANR